MTDTTDLDLSVLAKVSPPEQDEKPNTTGPERAPQGKPADEAPPPKPRRRISRPGAAAPVPPTPEEPRSRSFVRDDDILLPEYKPGMFVKPITEAYMTVAAVVMPFNQPIAHSIMQNAEPCAKAWDNAAQADKRVRQYLLKAMSAGILLPLLIAHMPIATVIVVVLFPGKPRPEVSLPDQPEETINPVSNGFRRPR